eukprot:RCo014811
MISEHTPVHRNKPQDGPGRRASRGTRRGSRASIMPHHAANVNRQVGVLNHRVVSVLQMDMGGFHHLLDDETSLISIHSSVIQATSQAIQAHGGLSTPFAGDKVLAYWNVRNLRSDHASR